MTLLLTGYEPFGEYETNPSARVARELDGAEVSGREISGRVLSVEFDRIADEMRELVAEHDPDAILATGLAAGRAGVSVERVGINVADSGTTPDNAGTEPSDERIDPDDAAGYFATIPVVAVVDSLLASGIPARVSNSAGTHLCNNALYATRAHLEREGKEIPTGFAHLPLTPEMAADGARCGNCDGANEGDGTTPMSVQPSLPLSMQADAIREAFAVTLAERG